MADFGTGMVILGNMLKTVKSFADVKKEIDQIEVRQEMSKMIGQILEVQNENLAMSIRVRDLQEQLNRRQDSVFVHPFVFLKSDTERKEKLCLRCFDVDGKVVRLVSIGGTDWVCKGCTSQYDSDVEGSRERLLQTMRDQEDRDLFGDY